MAITFVGSDVGQQGANTTAITLTLPSHQADDVAIVFCNADESGTVPSWSETASSGWEKLREDNPTIGRDRVTAVFAKRLTSGSETNPAFNVSVAQEHSASVHVFRGVDTIDMFDAVMRFDAGQNDTTPINPPITSISDNAAIILFHAATHDDISVAGVPTTPSGLSLGETVLGSTTDHRHQFTAYDVDVGNAATFTPTAWTHTSSPTTTAEWTVYTLLLRNDQPVHVTDVNTDEQIDLGEENIVITGDGFEATQGTGTVELADGTNYSTATKVTQTIDSWSATSIQFDLVQGALSEGTNYVFVTNDSGERNIAFAINLGEVQYDVRALLPSRLPDHYWPWDGDHTEVINGNDSDNVTAGSPSFPATPLTRSSSNALLINALTERAETADSAFMNVTNTLAQRVMGGWVKVDSIYLPATCLYEEGGGVNNIYFALFGGNVLLANIADTGDFNVQAYSNFRLTVGRIYHIMFRFEGSDDADEFVMYIDGIEQTVTSGNPPGINHHDTHGGDIGWGDPDANLDTGGTDINYSGPTDATYAHWVTWSNLSGNGIPTDTEIREQLFEAGALADYTVENDTEANMQTDLDTIADTTRPDAPLAIRIEICDDGDFELIADDIVFDDRISMQVRYLGNDTLTWVNSGTSNLVASKVSAPNGTVTIIETAPITITVTDIATGNPIQNARVYLEADTGGPLTAGTVILNDVTNASGVASTEIRYSTSQPIIGRARRAPSGGPYYRSAGIVTTVSSVDGVSIGVALIPDD
jgi:hypothetical protein